MNSCHKLKSFGIVEAVISSMIVIIVLSAAVFLSMSATKTTEVNSSYNQAQHIADLILERLQLIKSNGRLYFDDVSRGQETVSIDCFDTNRFSGCLSGMSEDYPLDQFPYRNLAVGSDGYITAPNSWFDSSAFGDGYFKFIVLVEQLSSGCHTSGTISVDNTKCRKVTISVKWEEQSREQNYKQAVYITDWER